MVKDQKIRHGDRRHRVRTTVVVGKLNEDGLCVERLNNGPDLATRQLFGRSIGQQSNHVKGRQRITSWLRTHSNHPTRNKAGKRLPDPDNPYRSYHTGPALSLDWHVHTPT